MWWYLHKLIRLSRLVRPSLDQYWMWCRSTRRDSQPGNRHRHVSRSRAARRSAAFGRRRRRPRSSSFPALSCSIQVQVAVQAIIWAAVGLMAGPSSTWQRAGWAGLAGWAGTGGPAVGGLAVGGPAVGVSAE